MSRPPVTELPSSVFVADRGGPVPLYHELATKLEQAIVSGGIPPGGRLEDELTLSHRLGVSRPTIRRAIQELVDKGLIVRRRGIGSQVVPPATLSRRFELTSLWEDLEKRGLPPTTQVLVHEVIPADLRVADDLGIAEGSDVLHIKRLRLADGVPLAIMNNHLPAEFADITREDLETRGLYELLGRRGADIRVAHQRVTAKTGAPDETELLDLPAGDPLLVLARVAFGHSGRAIETSRHLYPPDRYAFEATLVRS